MIRDKKNYNILIIEDNLGDFTLIADYLSEIMINATFTHTKNFASSKQILTNGEDQFQIILLDLSLPDKSGEVLITEIVELAYECPIIVLTGYTDIEFSIKSLSLGVSDYLVKEDINASSLYKSIMYAIERKKDMLQLAASEKRYSELFHLSPQPTWVYSQETGGLIKVNNAAINHYGYSKEEFLQISFGDIGDPKESPALIEILNKNQESDENTFVGVFKHFKKTGEEIQVEIYCKQININNTVCKTIIGFDITDKIEIINSLRQEKQQSSGFQSQLLSSQLNPHFIFNTLNSFQYYILRGEIEETMHNISQFSKLMRQVLENSDTAFISFTDEIKFINSYVDISKKRISQNLDFSIKISDGFRLSKQFIPPMLLQPYIENAFEHGFLNVNYTCQLLIEIGLKDGIVTCKIIDNGVGRNAAIRQNSIEKQKKSMAMGINLKRIELLNESFGRNFTVEVKDSLNTHQNTVGTEVIISFEEITVDEI
jgi:PAS domain S-box-containing protein